MRLPYNVIIQGSANGFVVSVGCETFVFNSLPSLMTDLGGYLQNPEIKIMEYQEKYPAILGERRDAPQLNPVQAMRNRLEGGVLAPASEEVAPEGSF